ncbi:putative transmembrane anti-sigma factor [Mycobacterium xenopi 4042]|uniref:Putative transmembrane anti-sigma factor n=1 Tax=Mycobacterium xenopi 4042 TaxID=1299334 RepID=X7YKI8_MYCXE|nr:putative transmembrane anti-sigma factor [Mycobacterium xenopi 4042]
MDVCPSCRSAVAELSGMPALLSQLDRDELAAIDEADRTGGAPPLPAELLPSLLARVGWRRRRSRVLTWAAGARPPWCWRSVCSWASKDITQHPRPPRRRPASRHCRWRRSAPRTWLRRSRCPPSSGVPTSR